MRVVYDEAKFTELLLYVAERLAGDRAGGATKLNKVLFFADFAHVRRHGTPITGAEYQKLPQGPAPRRLKPVRDGLVASRAAKVAREEFLGYELHRLVPLRSADLSVLTEDELETIDRVLADLEGLNARQVSDLSHEEAGWRLVDEGDVIPYEAALVGARQVLTPTSERSRARDGRAVRLATCVIREVPRFAQAVYEKAHELFVEHRSVEGMPSEYDFVGGPLAAALFAFRDFERSRTDVVPACVRTQSSTRSSAQWCSSAS